MTPKLQADIVASFQWAAVEVLVHKTIKSAEEYGVQTVLLGGGVSANSVLRNHLKDRCAKIGVTCRLSPLKYSGDNAAMIALAGYYQYSRGGYVQADVTLSKWRGITASPNLKLI